MPRLGTGLGTGAVSGDERHADGVAFESLDDLGAAHSALPDVKRKPRVAAGFAKLPVCAGSCARQESNLRPRAPEARALSPELQALGRQV